MCDHAPLSVQSVASLCLTPVTRPDDSVLVPMLPLESACNEQTLVAFGLWDPTEHRSQVFDELATEVAMEAALCMYTKVGGGFYKGGGGWGRGGCACGVLCWFLVLGEMCAHHDAAHMHL